MKSTSSKAITSLGERVDIIANEYNRFQGTASLNSDENTTSIQISNEKIDLKSYDVTLEGLGLKDIDASTKDGLEAIQNARKKVREYMVETESTMQKIFAAQENLYKTQTIALPEESKIRDVDFASESATFDKQSILAQAGSYAGSQANANPQMTMSLLS